LGEGLPLCLCPLSVLPVSGAPVVSFSDQSLPMNRKRLIQYFVALICGCRGWQNDKIKCVIGHGPCHLYAETFPDDAFNAITSYGPGTGFF